MLPSDDLHPPIAESPDDESVSLIVESVVAHHQRALVRRGHLRGPGGFHKSTIVKTIPPNILQGENHRNLVMSAVSRSAQLSHPSIAQIYDATVGEGDELSIVSEWIEGYTVTAILERSLTRSIPLPAHIIVWILKSVADALIFARDASASELASSGLPHGHLHPNNIFVRVDGQVKVTDFGLAASLGHGAYLPTNDGASGVFSYMAPEQINSWIIDEQTDVFALGVLLYELSIGEQPFSGRTDVETCDAIRRGLAVLPRERFPDFPEALESIIERACAINPVVRFQSVDEFREALVSALEGDAASATRTAMAAVLTILFPEQARTHTGQWQLPQSGGERRKLELEAPTEVEKRQTWLLGLGAFVIVSLLFWLLIYPQL